MPRQLEVESSDPCILMIVNFPFLEGETSGDPNILFDFPIPKRNGWFILRRDVKKMAHVHTNKVQAKVLRVCNIQPTLCLGRDIQSLPRQTPYEK